MMRYDADWIRQVIQDFIHHHCIWWLVGNEFGRIGAHELRPSVALASGKRDGLLAVVHAEIPAVPQTLLQDPL
jgi:hypothetical protein